MKSVVLDALKGEKGSLDWASLEAFGELTVYEETGSREYPLIAERLHDAEVCVVNRTHVSKATMASCPKLNLIAVMNQDFSPVDCAAAMELGITVVYLPERSRPGLPASGPGPKQDAPRQQDLDITAGNILSFLSGTPENAVKAPALQNRAGKKGDKT